MTVPVMTVPTGPQEMSPRLPDHMLPKSNHSTTKLVCPSSDGDGQLQRYVGPILCLRTARRWNIEKTGPIRCQSRTNTHHVSHQKGMWSLKTCPERVARHKGQDQAEACISFGDACNPSACEYFTWSIVKWLRFPSWSHWMLTALIAKRSDPGSSTTATWSRVELRGVVHRCREVHRVDRGWSCRRRYAVPIGFVGKSVSSLDRCVPNMAHSIDSRTSGTCTMSHVGFVAVSCHSVNVDMSRDWLLQHMSSKV